MITITKEQAKQIIEAADEVITALAGTNEDVHPDNSTKMVQLYDDLNDHYAPPEVVRELARIALASLEAEPVAYIFKHPAGRLFWSLTDESNKGQSDVMPVYSAPVPAFVPPAIEPDYEVIKGILPTANPDEYACCIAADMWNACRAAMLQGAGNSESQHAVKALPLLNSSVKDIELQHADTRVNADSNSPVIPGGYALVPIEPTTNQWAAGMQAFDSGMDKVTRVYKAMLTAAPQQEVK